MVWLCYPKWSSGFDEISFKNVFFRERIYGVNFKRIDNGPYATTISTIAVRHFFSNLKIGVSLDFNEKKKKKWCGSQPVRNGLEGPICNKIGILIFQTNECKTHFSLKKGQISITIYLSYFCKKHSMIVYWNMYTYSKSIVEIKTQEFVVIKWVN